MNLRAHLLEARDGLQHSALVRRAMSLVQASRSRIPSDADSQQIARSLRRLTSAARVTPSEGHLRSIEDELGRRVARIDPDRVDWSEVIPDARKTRLAKTAILKPYLGPDEKGVLFISFPNNWLRLLALEDYRRFASEYSLVVAPSWSRPHDVMNYLFPLAWPDPVHTIISNPKDLGYFPRISANYRPIPLYASSWVDSELFRPRPRSGREFDLVMVANFGRFKRHIALFRALRTMRKGMKILLIGQDQDGRTDRTILEEARAFGVADRFTVRRDVPYEGIAEAFGNARASVVLSRREGSCVVIAESLFADTPAALLEDAEIGSKTFLNERTGRLLRHRRLGEQLQSFIDESGRYEPRRWAIENIDCRISSRVLNEALRASLTAQGQSWTRDIADLCWRPDPYVLNVEDRHASDAERARIARVYGIEAGDLYHAPGPAASAALSH